MEIKPVKETKIPEYPVKETVTEEQLKKQVPRRWTDNKAAKLALGTLAAMTLSGCEVSPPLAGVPMPPETPVPVESPCPSQSPMIEVTTAGVPMAQTFQVAPLFEHGSGQGAFGCVMVAPPVFLTEAEALDVINEAAKEYGLTFSSKGSPELSNVLQPVTNLYGDKKDSKQTYMTMAPDFIDAEHKVAIEFVSTEDVAEWQQRSENEVSAGTYDTKDAALQLSNAFANAFDTGYSVSSAGVFYDPCEKASESEPQLKEILDQEDYDKLEKQSREYERQSREMSEEQLKKQAVDFFKWLKEQGLI